MVPYIDFVAEVKNLQKRINKKIETAFGDYGKPYSHISHTTRAVSLEIKLPGIKKNNFFVNINRRRAEILAEYENNQQRSTSKKKILKGFYRSILLPPHLDIMNVAINFHKETLKITFPRKMLKKKIK